MNKNFIIIILMLITIGATGCTFTKAEKSDIIIKDDYQLQIHSDQSSYMEDEKINFWAALKYLGEAEEVTIGHGSHYLTFAIKQLDGDLEFVGGMDFSYNFTKLEQGTESITEYTKRGGYTNDDPNASIYEAFYSESDVYLPIGEYKLTATANFDWIETDGVEIEPIHYTLPAETVITVIEAEK